MFIGNQRAAYCGKGKAKVIRAFLSRKELSPVHLTNTEKQTECKEISGGTLLVLVKQCKEIVARFAYECCD